MRVESRVGHGSTFFFSLLAQAVPVPAQPDALKQPLHGKRVLVVDPSPSGRRATTLQVQAWGVVTEEVGSVLQASDLIRNGARFDAAILDIATLDDDLAARQLRQLYPQLPLIALARHGRREESDRGATFAHILRKPMKHGPLQNALTTLFSPTSTPATSNAASQYDTTLGERLPLRILLAEDVPINVKLVTAMLSKMGYRADVAANGHEVLRSLSRQEYDVVLMDVHMPEMDGLEASREIHRLWPDGARPSIIALTAAATPEDQRVCESNGMDDYLSKPVRVRALQEALTRVAERKRQPPVDHGALQESRQGSDSGHLHVSTGMAGWLQLGASLRV